MPVGQPSGVMVMPRNEETASPEDPVRLMSPPLCTAAHGMAMSSTVTCSCAPAARARAAPTGAEQLMRLDASRVADEELSARATTPPKRAAWQLSAVVSITFSFELVIT